MFTFRFSAGPGEAGVSPDCQMTIDLLDTGYETRAQPW
jgi:hypothetical protein